MEEGVIQSKRRTVVKAVIVLLGILSIVGVTFFIYSRQVLDKTTVINGVAVPPEPAPWVNNSTLAGVDSNNNGVRDDIDRTIARQFGGTPDYSFALAYARQYQQLITSPIPSERKEALIVYSRVMCTVAGSSESVHTFKVDSLTANTPAREQVLRDFLDVLVGFGSRELQPCAN